MDMMKWVTPRQCRAIHRFQRRIKWRTIIFEFLGETALPIAGISDDALTQFFSVVDKLRINSPRDSAERDKPSKTTDSLHLNAQSWTRIVTEVLGERALSVQTIPEDVLIQILEVVYEMRIHPESPDLIGNDPSNSPSENPERQPAETDGPIPPQDCYNVFVGTEVNQMALIIISLRREIYNVQRRIKWLRIIFEFLGETALPIAGISDDALTQFFSVVDKLRVNSPIARDSAERDKPRKTTDSLQLNAQSWTRIVTEVLGETALSVQSIPDDVLIQILEVVFAMRILPESPDLVENVPNNSQPGNPERQPMETEGPIPLEDLVDLGAASMNTTIPPKE